MAAAPNDGDSSSKTYGSEVQPVDLLSFRALQYHHCFRPTMLTSLSSGAAVVLIQALRTRSTWRATSHGIFAFCAAALVLWPLCRVQQSKRTRTVREMLEKNAVQPKTPEQLAALQAELAKEKRK